MNLATLRVEGVVDALESLKSAISLNVDDEWKKGDKRRSGASHEASGFSLTVADTQNPLDLLEMIRKFIGKLKESRITIIGSGLKADLMIGISVGDTEQFVASIDLTPSELLALGELGIAFSVTAYPTSDEVNVEERIL